MEEVRRLTVRYTRAALRELDAITASIHAESPSGARRLRRRIDQIADRIGTFPEAGGSTHGTVRKVVATPFPYLVFFRIADEGIVVTAVRHGARDPSTMPGAPDPGDD